MWWSECLILDLTLDFSTNEEAGPLKHFSATNGINTTTTTTYSPTISDEFTNIHSFDQSTVTSKSPLLHDLPSLKNEPSTSHLSNEITTPHVFNISHQKTTLLAHFSTESQETTPPIIQSTTVTHGITRTTLSSASSSFLHDYNVSMTSNDSTSILTNPVFNMTDLTTTAVEPGIVTNSLNVTDFLGTKHDQLIYIIIATSILFICTFLSVYVVIKKKNVIINECMSCITLVILILTTWMTNQNIQWLNLNWEHLKIKINDVLHACVFLFFFSAWAVHAH